MASTQLMKCLGLAGYGVTGMRLQYSEDSWGADRKGVTGIRLYCNPWKAVSSDNHQSLEQFYPYPSRYGTDFAVTGSKYCTETFGFITGFRVKHGFGISTVFEYSNLDEMGVRPVYISAFSETI